MLFDYYLTLKNEISTWDLFLRKCFVNSYWISFLFGSFVQIQSILFGHWTRRIQVRRLPLAAVKGRRGYCEVN